jgi:DNA polymerase III subunit alpha
MKNKNFTHLHLHTEYSLLDGAIRVLDLNGQPGEVFSLANKYGMSSIAITDHGNMYGVIEFYLNARKSGIKPIIGCEVYVAPNSRLDKTPSQNETAYHLTLLCKDYQGYTNLMKLVSIGYLEGFYYKPRVDKEVLLKYKDGLIALSGCLKGEIPQYIIKKNMDETKRILNSYLEIFGTENFYLELQDHGIPEQKKANTGLISLSEEFKIKCIATNDSHYVTKNQAYMQEVLLCIGTAKTIDDVSRMKFSSDEFYFKSYGEMLKLFPDIPDAVSNTLEIADRCNVELDFSKVYLPEYKVPKEYSLDSFLEKLCDEGLKIRYSEITDEIKNRLEHELKIIKDMGYSGYFLIVWDFIKFAKNNGVPVGPGRGSGAGSIVSYLLGITDVDPLKYGLIFERFLNPNRKTMPDLDIDFSDQGREQVIKYVIEKYGESNVAQIVTFGSMQARLAVRDIGRVLNIPLKDVDRIAKLIPPGVTAYEALNSNDELKKIVKENNSYSQLFELTRQIEGIKRHIGVHAAGIVIAKDNITSYVPFTKSNKDVATTQYEGDYLVKLGLLKMDFLGLRNLTVIDETVKLIKKFRNEDLDINNISLEDKKTYELLGEAKSKGIFQMESSGMRDLLRKIKPTCLEDIIALIALYRPGPMGSGMLDDFVSRKHGKSKIKYDHKLLEPILKDTYGVILYQEQVMQMAVTLAGFTPAQADNLRQAMGKKIQEIIEKERDAFVKGAKSNNITEALATKIFENIAKFGGYGFNKSHSTAYGILTYRTAYLKANYPLEYMTALLNSEIGDIDKTASDIAECKDMNIEILPPDIHNSFKKFSIEGSLEDKKIRFGFLAIKNVGNVDSIIEAREKKNKFKDFTDFLKSVDSRLINKKVVESLIKAGAFDSLGYKRASLIGCSDNLIGVISKASKENVEGQGSLFDNTDQSFDTKEKIDDVAEWNKHELLINEKEVLGLYMSGHPLSSIEKDLKLLAPSAIESIKNYKDSSEVTLGGIITHVKKMKTKKGDDMAVFKIEDMSAEMEVVIFPKTYRDIQQNVLNADNIVIVKGKVDASGEIVKVLGDSVMLFNSVKEYSIKKMIVNLNTVGLDEKILNNTKEVFSKYPGRCRIFFDMNTTRHGNILVQSNYYVNPAKELELELKSIFGEEAFRYEI